MHRLAGKRVLVNAHDFFEEGTRRNLPLSATLRERFSSELSSRGVAVFALPEGSEDDMVILQGIWRDVSEPDAESGTRTIHLTVKLVERTADGHRVLLSPDGRVKGIDARLLNSDLASWGRHVVRKLEDRARQRQRRNVRVGEVVMDGVPEPDRARRYLVRRWLVPAFAQSRLFGLVVGGGGQSDATLQVDVFMHSAQVEIVLDVRDGAGGPISATTVAIAKELFPPGLFDEAQFGTVVTGTGEKDDKVLPPQPPPPPGEVTVLLERCAAYERAHRLTMPSGANAADCYAQVLERDPENAQAQAGLEPIRRRYAARVQGMIERGTFDEARGVVEQLRRLSPEHPRVPELEGEIAGAERKAEEERRRAEERRIAELTPEMVRIEGGGVSRWGVWSRRRVGATTSAGIRCA